MFFFWTWKVLKLFANNNNYKAVVCRELGWQAESPQSKPQYRQILEDVLVVEELLGQITGEVPLSKAPNPQMLA